MKLTGSGFERAEKCAPSTFLPGISSEASVYAKVGSAVHRFLCLAAETGREAALELMEVEHRETCAAIDLDSLPHASPGAWGVEVAFAWDWRADTARELYRGSGARKYEGLSADEVPGTADLIGLDGDTVIVLDLKTGWRPLGPPAESLQLGYYAVAAARAYGATRATVGFIRLVDGEPRYECANLDEFDLAAMAERLKGVVVTALEAELEHEASGETSALVVGPHCTYCPAFRVCPANVALLRDLAKATEAAPEAALPVLDAETAPRVWQRLEAAQKVLDVVKEALEAYAVAHPFDLPDGQRVGQVETTRESIDGEAARSVLPPDIYEAAAKVTVDLTKADLKRAARQYLPEGKKVTHFERELLESLRAAGATKASTYYSVRSFRPKALGDGQ